MRAAKLPHLDSVEQLARFWDSHDLTDFEDAVEEVKEPVFVRRTPINVPLPAREARALHKLAQAKGVSDGELIREWVLQKLRGKGNGAVSRKRVGKSRS